MAIYMIDYENVKTGGLNGISRLTKEDKVIIFYSENANRLTFDLHRRLMECPAQIEYREVTVGGHNALDFQLVTYLGYLIAKDPTGQYLIISYDRGFEYVVNFWRKDGLCIGLLPYLKDPSYALSRVIKGEPVCRAEKAEEAPEEKGDEDLAEEVDRVPPEEAELPAEDATVSPVEEAPAEEAPKTIEPDTKEALPEEEPGIEVEFFSIEEEPTAPPALEVPVEEPPVQVKPAQKTSSKKKSSSKKTKAEQPKVKLKAELMEEPKEEPKAEPKPKVEPKEQPAVPSLEELKVLLGDLVADDPEARFVRGALEKYKTKLGLNNALVKNFGNQRAGEIYQKVKPLLTTKKK